MKIQSSVFHDKLELCDATGEVVKEIPFTINLTSSVQAVLNKREELDAVDKNDVEAMGAAFQELLGIVFGKSIADELIAYYQNDYMAMIAEMAPVLTDYIFPVFYKYRKTTLDARKKIKK